MSQKTTVNKIGGSNMSQMEGVGALVKTLRENNERPLLVVSAFQGVTNLLIQALDALDGTDYTKETILAAFAPALKIIHAKIEEFLPAEGGTFRQRALEYVTGQLEACIEQLLTHKQITNVLKPQKDSYGTRDVIIGFGEWSVIGVLEQYLLSLGVSAKRVEGVRYVASPEQNGNGISMQQLHANIQAGLAQALRPHVARENNTVLIVSGHVPGTPHGMVQDIGRSYSDTTAVDASVAVESQLHTTVDEIVFWKDVDGVLTANPKMLDKAVHTPRHHSDISLREGLEMAAGGSSLLQTAAMALALDCGMNLTVKNMAQPNNAGTTYSVNKVQTKFPFKAIIENPHVDLITFDVPGMVTEDGFVTAIAHEFGKEGERVSINDIMTEGTRITVTVPLPSDKADKEERRKRIRKHVKALNTININGEKYNCAIDWDQEAYANVSVVGEELSGQKGILGTIGAVLASNNVNVFGITHTTSQRKVSFYVLRGDMQKAVQCLHGFFIDKDPQMAEKVRTSTMERLTGYTAA